MSKKREIVEAPRGKHVAHSKALQILNAWGLSATIQHNCCSNIITLFSSQENQLFYHT